MSKLPLSAFEHRKPLGEILSIPPKVISVYSLVQHVWAGTGDEERRKSKKTNKVRLETLDEFFIDPVRSYLHRILQAVAENQGQGFWIQAEFGVGKSHLLASSAIIAIGGKDAWDKVKEREDEEGRAGPGARLDTVWRKKIEKRRIFPIVFSLEGRGGGHERKLVDFILDEAQETFALKEGKPLAVYPEEHLAATFLKEHQRALRDDLRTFLADKRLMQGLPRYEYDELIEALKAPAAQRDAGRVLMAFYRHKSLTPKIPSEHGERLSRAMRDILEAGYDGIFIAIDEMSEYLRRSQFTADDEDCLLTLSSTLAKAEGLPLWIAVAAQAAHTNPRKIIGPDRMREELLEHKEERFRDIVVQRTRTITDPKAVETYRAGYSQLIPWVHDADKEEFEAAFPFPPDALRVLRNICLKLTGTRSTISFLHKALKEAAANKERELVPLWRVFPDLMSYAETPSTSSSGAISIQSAFRQEVAALTAAQATLKRITDGQLARPQNRTRAERILNTLFLYHLAGVQGLTLDQILDAVCDLKPGEDQLEAQRGHYETILEEMTSKLRNQIHHRQGRYAFVPKETTQIDELAFQAAERIRSDAQLLWQMMDRLLTYAEPDAPSPFAEAVPSEEAGFRSFTIKSWHGQERTGKVAAVDVLTRAFEPEVDTHGSGEDFLVVVARRPMTEKQVEGVVRKKDKAWDPRIVVWAPAQLREEERSSAAAVLAYLLVADENKGTGLEKDALRQFRNQAARAYDALREIYWRGVAKSSRTSMPIPPGSVENAIAAMAGEAMDTCYLARSIDFGNRRFDTQGAVKLINGLVKRGEAVSQGDQLWSAVENFAGPLGLVRPDLPTRLDPGNSRFYEAIRSRVTQRGGIGFEVRTVYNWFTGYDPKDGKESWGLTREMVALYLLCMVRQGLIRISLRRGGWIDRNNIAGIDFKPVTLREMERVELPRPLDDWAVFYRYLEVLLSRREGSLGPVPEGSLGPMYDRAKAEEALRSLWDGYWIDVDELSRIEQEIRALFATLGRPQQNPFDDLLLYWMAFAEERLPAAYVDSEVFDALRRAVLKAAGVAHGGEMEEAHFIRFKENFQKLTELQQSFKKTSASLLQASRLAYAPLGEAESFKSIAKVQEDVRVELAHPEELILSPDRVTTRLRPRIDTLENTYIPLYVEQLMHLGELQRSIEQMRSAADRCPELQMLADFAADLPAAAERVEVCKKTLDAAPERLRQTPEDDKAVRDQVKRDGSVLDCHGEKLTLRRLVEECKIRERCVTDLEKAGREAATGFAAFLRVPKVAERGRVLVGDLPAFGEVLNAENDAEAADALVTMPAKDRKELAKRLKAVLGGRRVKTVRVADFSPRTNVVWERADIGKVVDEFRLYLEGELEDETYLKIE
jgi:hypothetical protein